MQNKKLLSVLLALMLVVACAFSMLMVGAQAEERVEVTWTVGTDVDSVADALADAAAKTDWTASDALVIDMNGTKEGVTVDENGILFGLSTIFDNGGARLPITIQNGTLTIPTGFTGNMVCANSYTFKDLTFPILDTAVVFYAGSGEVTIESCDLDVVKTAKNTAVGKLYADCPVAAAFEGWSAPAAGEKINVSLHIKDVDMTTSDAQASESTMGVVGDTDGFEAENVSASDLAVELIFTDVYYQTLVLRSASAMSPVSSVTFTANDTAESDIQTRFNAIYGLYNPGSAVVTFPDFDYTVNLNAGSIASESPIVKKVSFTGDYVLNITGGTWSKNLIASYSDGGQISGKNEVNISGGTFSSYYGPNTAAEGFRNVNNVTGGTFTKFMGNRVAGEIINNVYGGTFTTYCGSYDTTGGGGNYDITNNIYGGEFEIYYGTGGTTAGDSAGYTVDSVVNNLVGGKITGNCLGTGKIAKVIRVENNLLGTEIEGSFFGHSNKGSASMTAYAVSSTISASTVHGNFYGGYTTLNSSNKITDEDGTYTVKNKMIGGTVMGNFRGSSDNQVAGNMINIVDGNFVLGGTFSGTTQKVLGGIENRINGGTFKAAFYGANSKNPETVSVVNTINGGTFEAEFYGTAAPNPTVSTTINGGTFHKVYYGTGTNTAKNVTNVLNGGTFKSSWYGTGGTVSGNVTNTFAGGNVAGEVDGTKGETQGNVYNTMTGGEYCTSTSRYFFYGTRGLTHGEVVNTFDGNFKTMSQHKDKANSYLTGGETKGKITNHFYSAAFTAVVYCNDGNFSTIENHFYDGFTSGVTIYGAAGGGTAISGSYAGGEITSHFYDGCNLSSYMGADGKNDRVVNIAKVTNHVYEGANVGTFKGSVRRGAALEVENNVYGGTIEAYYGGTELGLIASSSKDPDVHDTVITNNISGGTITTYYGGNAKSNRNWTNDTIINNVSGGNITNYFGGSEGTTEIDYEIVNNITGGVIKAYCGSGYAAVAGDASNTSADYYVIENNIFGGLIGGVVTDGQMTGTNTSAAYSGNLGNVTGNLLNNLNGATVGGWFTGAGKDGNASTINGDVTTIVKDSFLAVFRGNRGGTIKGDMKNYFYDSTVVGAFWASHAAIDAVSGAKGTLYTEINGGNYSGAIVVAGTNATDRGQTLVVRDNAETGTQAVINNVVSSGSTLPTAARPSKIYIENATVLGTFKYRSGSSDLPIEDAMPDHVYIYLSGEIRVGSASHLVCTSADDVVLTQIDSWTTGHTFFTAPEAYASEITTANATPDVGGMAFTDTTSKPGYTLFIGYCMEKGSVLASMDLQDRMVLKLWFPKETVDSFIESTGLPFEFKIVLDPSGDNTVIGTGSVPQPRLADTSFVSDGATKEYYIFTLSGIGGGSYDKTISFVGSGFTFENSIMNLADTGAQAYKGTQHEPLFQAIYDYGAAATGRATKYDTKLKPTTEGVAQPDFTVEPGNTVSVYTIDALMGDAVGVRMMAEIEAGFNPALLTVTLDGKSLVRDVNYSLKTVGEDEVYIELFFTADSMSKDMLLAVSYNGQEIFAMDGSVEGLVAAIVEQSPTNDMAWALLAYIQTVREYLGF